MRKNLSTAELTKRWHDTVSYHCYTKVGHPNTDQGSHYGLRRSETPGQHQNECLASGRFHYKVPGASKISTADWGGACFAQWKYCNPENRLIAVDYYNPFNYLEEMTPQQYRYYQPGWDRVIRPCLSTLPAFDELWSEEYYTAYIDDMSLVEASFLWRMIRVYAENEPFASSVAILAHKFPSSPPPVLFALATMGHWYPAGYSRKMYLQFPNCTINTSLSMVNSLSFMRNMIWSMKEGRWDWRKLTLDRSTYGPHSRQYFGHSRYWYGHPGGMFKVRLFMGNKDITEAANDSRMWSLQGKGHDPYAVETADLVDVFHAVYDVVRDEDHDQAVDVELDEFSTSHIGKAIQRVQARAAGERLW